MSRVPPVLSARHHRSIYLFCKALHPAHLPFLLRLAGWLLRLKVQDITHVVAGAAAGLIGVLFTQHYGVVIC